MASRAATQRLGTWDKTRLAWRLYRDPRVSPRLKKVVSVFGLVYVLSPLDLVPDIFLGFGQLDDLGVMSLVAAASYLLPRFASADVLAEHLRAMGLLRDAKNQDEAHVSRSAPPPTDVIDARFHVRG